GRSVDRSTLTEATQVALAIAMSGARLDLDQPDLALGELEISQLDPTKAFSYSPELFRAYAEVLEELGRTEESAEWSICAEVAEQALETSTPGENESDEDIVVIEEELEGFDDEDSAAEAAEDAAEIPAEDFSADDVAGLFDEVVSEGDAEVFVDVEPEVTVVEEADESVVILDFDEDLLEEDVVQVLRDTAHLAREEGNGESRA
ncbi:MAG: hypothetical protein JJE28_05585, partial [Actinomycetales bacterium]|nr:hypothetical protein [Actinomycetales bacterium]